MNTRTHLTTAALALAGAGLWFSAGGALQEKGGFEHQPNPLGIKRSPYGQVLAMAIQGPVDQDFHMVLAPGHESAGTTHSPANAPAGPHPAARETADPPLIERLEDIASRRTNPNPPTPAHKFYLRSKVEDRLRFAYELDPSHYGNYNSFHLFLTEPELGTENTVDRFFEGRERADRLAGATIRYCLADETDPRPALTAATAAYNILETMYFRPERHSLEEMRHQLDLIDDCLERHQQLLDFSVENGTWELLSVMRQNEILERARLTRTLRDTARGTLRRLARERSSTASRQGS